MHTLANTGSPTLRRRVLQYVRTGPCPVCGGTRLRPESLAVTVAGCSIAELTALPMTELVPVLRTADLPPVGEGIAADLVGRIEVLTDLGLGYLSLSRTTPTLSPGELQRLRIATQLRSGLFGVVYVLDEPSAGLHPADTEQLLTVLDQLIAAGNSLFVIEHDMAVARRADWVVDVGPRAGVHGGRVLYSGPVAGLADVEESVTRRFLADRPAVDRARRQPSSLLRLSGISRHNLRDAEVVLPLGVLTAVTGVSGSGKSTLVSQVLADVVAHHLGTDDGDDSTTVQTEGLDALDRLVQVDQKPIGRTPRSNLATYTGLFDVVRKLFAGTDEARARGWSAGRFSFNVAEGRCPTCQGEGFVAVELLFLPGSYAPCPTCHGARYSAETLEVTLAGKTIAEVLDLTVEAAQVFLADVPAAARSLRTLQEVGLGYLRLGQPATELSGGEAQRVKLASELQRTRRGHTLYLLDEPTTGLHPADVEVLMASCSSWSTPATPSSSSSTTWTSSPRPTGCSTSAPGAGTPAGRSWPPGRRSRWPPPAPRPPGSWPRAYARWMSYRRPLDELRETVGRLGEQLPRPGGRGVDELVGDLFGGRPAPARPLAAIQATWTR